MTKKEIIEMAKQVKLPYDYVTGEIMWLDSIEQFAKLIAEKEREACAKMVEDSWMAFSRTPNSRLDITPFPELTYVAKAIRARGQE
jgi:hypothetical protein